MKCKTLGLIFRIDSDGLLGEFVAVVAGIAVNISAANRFKANDKIIQFAVINVDRGRAI